MSDILADLKAPSLFCISLRKRAAEKIAELREWRDQVDDDNVALNQTIRSLKAEIDELRKMNRHLNDHVARLRKCLRDAREALGND